MSGSTSAQMLQVFQSRRSEDSFVAIISAPLLLTLRPVRVSLHDWLWMQAK